MKLSKSFRIGAVLAAGVMTFGLAACGERDESSSSSNKNDKESASSSMQNTNQEFGSGCSAVPKDGKGSFEGMSADNVATAASNNPVLSTLVTAVQKAELVDTLNGSKNITVFAPTNEAFAKIPEADLQKVLNDKETLTKILTYHVVAERVAPTQLTDKSPLTSMEGAKLEVTGEDEDFTVNGNSKVVCGNVQTANATVYIVDTVLMPAI